MVTRRTLHYDARPLSTPPRLEIGGKISRSVHDLEMYEAGQSAEAEQDQALLLTLKAPRIASATYRVPGQMLWLNCPSISRLQWHPFSVLSSTGKEIALLVHETGDWTRALCRALNSHQSNRDLALYADGPYYSVADEYERHEQVILVSAGIGCIPFASVLEHLARVPECRQPRTLYTVWVLRYHHQIRWISAQLKRAKALFGNRIYIRVYLTKDDVGRFWYDYMDAIEPGRPHFPDLLSVQPRNRTYGVFICGAKPMMNEMAAACRTKTNVGTRFIPKRVKG